MTVIPNIPEAELPQTVEAVLPGLLKMFDGDKEALKEAIRESLGPPWPSIYKNRETGKVYKPHHDQESALVYSDQPRYQYLRGGEGGGKSVGGIIKDLERIRRGCSGILCSPDMPHFKKSLWPEFQRWCPWEQVVEKHRRRGDFDWEPYAPFVLAFENGARLYCGGMDEPGSWEGPNVNFAHFDEARRKRDPRALKVLDGRVRIPMLHQGIEVPPQIWLTSTPRKPSWLYDYFGPLKVLCSDCGSSEPIAIQEGESFACKECGSTNLIVEDEHGAFKRNSMVVVLYTKDNEENLEENFAAKRAQTLTEAEARVLLDAAWEDAEEGQPFLPHISWWDDCREELPPIEPNEPLILSVDAATGRMSGESDCFAIVGITRHPDPTRRHDSVAVRYLKVWQAAAGDKIDFIGTERDPGPERELLRLCGWHIGDDGKYVRVKQRDYNVKCIVIDPHELNDLAQRFSRKRIAWVKEFGQMDKRYMADTDFLRLIAEKRIAHDGNSILRSHIQNADRKLSDDGRRMRAVKREDAYKIDALVAASQGAYWTLYLQL
jgi:hypothetical protein